MRYLRDAEKNVESYRVENAELKIMVSDRDAHILEIIKTMGENETLRGHLETYAQLRGEALIEVEVLQAFKSWVHAYLDDKGIPTHPDGPHSAEGCRIGDRLDLVFERISRWDEFKARYGTNPEHVQQGIKAREDCLTIAEEEVATLQTALNAEVQSGADRQREVERLEGEKSALVNRLVELKKSRDYQKSRAKHRSGSLNDKHQQLTELSKQLAALKRLCVAEKAWREDKTRCLKDCHPDGRGGSCTELNPCVRQLRKREKWTELQAALQAVEG